MPPTDPHDALYDRLLAQHGMVHTGEGQFVYQGSGTPVDTTHPDVVSRFQQVHAQAQAQAQGGASRTPAPGPLPVATPPAPTPGQNGDPRAALTDPMALLRGLLASPARDATLRLVAMLRGSGMSTAPSTSPAAAMSGGAG